LKAVTTALARFNEGPLAATTRGGAGLSPGSRARPVDTAELYRNLVARYCRLIFEQLQYAWRIDHWIDTMLILPNGDARETITVGVVVECEGLDFFKIYTGPGWRQPEKYRRLVTITARTIKIDGTSGTRADVTSAWTARGNLEILAHFEDPIPQGKEMGIQVELTWPARCAPLMRWNVREEFVVDFRSPVRYFEYRITLPPGSPFDYRTIGLVDGEDAFESSSGSVNGGENEVCLTVRDLCEDRRVGLLLEVGKGAPEPSEESRPGAQDRCIPRRPLRYFNFRGRGRSRNTAR
jgi:hypothetical protein